MRFYAHTAGYRVRVFGADDGVYCVDDAAEKMAEHVYESEIGDTPRDSYDVTVMDDEGRVSRHDVVLEFEPSFAVDAHKEKPGPDVVAELQAARARAA